MTTSVGKRSTRGGPHLLRELDDQRQLVGLDERKKVLFGQLSVEGVAPFIKLQRKHLDRHGLNPPNTRQIHRTNHKFIVIII